MSTDTTHRQPTLPSIDFTRLGERLCLDFVNTKEHRLCPAPHELLLDFHALIAWARTFGIVTEQQAQSLLNLTIRAPQAAQEALARALALRETLHRVFVNTAHREPADEADVQRIHDTYVEAMAHSRLLYTGGGYAFVSDTADMAPDYIVRAIARSAVEVLTVDPLARLRECPGLDDCGYLFLDTSKNGTRRWCSMDICGSRAKMRRQYARKRSERSLRHH